MRSTPGPAARHTGLMALTTRQRNALPRSAFLLHSGPRSAWRYPAPIKAQARRARISEAQRQRTLRSAASYGARRSTRGSGTRITAAAKKRSGGPRGKWGGKTRARASRRR